MVNETQTDDATHTANNALLVRFLNLLSTADVEALAGMVTDDWTMAGGPCDLPRGPEGLAEVTRGTGSGRPTWRVGQVLTQGDLVAVRATARYEAEVYFGAPAQLLTTFIMRVEGGRIASTWRHADDLGWLLHLGAQLHERQRLELATTGAGR